MIPSVPPFILSVIRRFPFREILIALLALSFAVGGRSN